MFYTEEFGTWKIIFHDFSFCSVKIIAFSFLWYFLSNDCLLPYLVLVEKKFNLINVVRTISDAVKIGVWFKSQRLISVTAPHQYPISNVKNRFLVFAVSVFIFVILTTTNV